MKTLLLALICVTASAQEPQKFVAVGAGFDQAKIAGFLSYGVKLAGTSMPVYSYTTIVNTNSTSSVRTGFMQVVLQSNGLIIAGLGDAGMASGNTSITSAFSFGGVAIYDASKHLLKVPGTYFMFSFRPSKTNVGGPVAGAWQASYQFGIGKSF